MPKPGSTLSVPQRTWHWSNSVWIALAPGISCFVAGKEYAHGSLSLQECLVPQLKVTATKTAPTASIKSAKWVQMRCKIEVEGNAAGLRVDLRTKLADPASSLVTPKPVDTDGTASVMVEDDSMLGTAAFLVLLTAAGQILEKQSTTVGGEE